MHDDEMAFVAQMIGLTASSSIVIVGDGFGSSSASVEDAPRAAISPSANSGVAQERRSLA